MENYNQLQLVSKEVAYKLKALGFNWPTTDLYTEEEEHVYDDGNVYQADNHNAYGPKVFSAPEVELAIKWLRIEKRINVDIISDYGDHNNIIRTYIITNEHCVKVKVDSFYDYYEAQTKGLYNALEYLLIKSL